MVAWILTPHGEEMGHTLERPSKSTYHGKVAALSRDREPEDPELIEAKRNLREANLADAIERTVTAWPPLTDQQLDRLAALLRPVSASRKEAA